MAKFHNIREAFKDLADKQKLNIGDDGKFSSVPIPKRTFFSRGPTAAEKQKSLEAYDSVLDILEMVFDAAFIERAKLDKKETNKEITFLLRSLGGNPSFNEACKDNPVLAKRFTDFDNQARNFEKT